MKPKKLSSEMKKCLDKMQTEESLFRTNGGLWTFKDVKMVEYGMDMVPEWFVSKATIEALIKRGLLMTWNSKIGHYGSVYSIEVKKTPHYTEQIKLYNYDRSNNSN